MTELQPIKTCEFWVRGLRGKGRPRFSRVGTTVRTYTDDKTAAYEQKIKKAYEEQYGDGLIYDDKDALAVTISAVCKIPKSATKADKKKMISGSVKPGKKTDIDNIAKVIMDALNKTAYPDDKQIYKLTIEKEYGLYDAIKIQIRNRPRYDK